MRLGKTTSGGTSQLSDRLRA